MEQDGQAFLDGEVEPRIHGRPLSIGAQFVRTLTEPYALPRRPARRWRPELGDPGSSRTTDLGRYRIIHGRTGVWTTVLEDALSARRSSDLHTLARMCSTTASASSPAHLRLCPLSSSGVTLRRAQVERLLSISVARLDGFARSAE
jgi:hypothetical protein